MKRFLLALLLVALFACEASAHPFFFFRHRANNFNNGFNAGVRAEQLRQQQLRHQQQFRSFRHR